MNITVLYDRLVHAVGQLLKQHGLEPGPSTIVRLVLPTYNYKAVSAFPFRPCDVGAEPPRITVGIPGSGLSIETATAFVLQFEDGGDTAQGEGVIVLPDDEKYVVIPKVAVRPEAA